MEAQARQLANGLVQLQGRSEAAGGVVDDQWWVEFERLMQAVRTLVESGKGGNLQEESTESSGDYKKQGRAGRRARAQQKQASQSQFCRG